MTVQVSRALRAPPASQAEHMFAPLQREISRVFADFGHGAFDVFAPSLKMDFSETKNAVEIAIELPGIQQDDVSITVDGNMLTISGEKKVETERKDEDYHLTERQWGAFSRSVRLPHQVDGDKIAAELKDGVLKITAPKVGPDTAKRIPVHTAKA